MRNARVVPPTVARALGLAGLASPGSANPTRKYRNKPVTIDGKRFASQKEARRYGELLLLQRAHKIGAIKLQPRYRITINGIHVADYVGDFEYKENAVTVVEDAKGMQTPVFKLKWRIVKAMFPFIDWRIV